MASLARSPLCVCHHPAKVPNRLVLRDAVNPASRMLLLEAIP
jgi:hypothetical protein